MPTNFPTRVDVFDIPSDDSTSLSSTGDARRTHMELHRDQGDAMEAVQNFADINTHDHSGPGKLSQANTHENADTDSSLGSLHHTLTSSPFEGTFKASSAIHDHLPGSWGVDNFLSNPGLLTFEAPYPYRYDRQIVSGDATLSTGQDGTQMRHLIVSGASQSVLGLAPGGVHLPGGNYELRTHVRGTPSSITINFKSGSTVVETETIAVTSDWTPKVLSVTIPQSGMHTIELVVPAEAMPLNIGPGMGLYAESVKVGVYEIQSTLDTTQYPSDVWATDRVVWTKKSSYPAHSDAPFSIINGTTVGTTNPGSVLRIDKSGYYSFYGLSWARASTHPNMQLADLWAYPPGTDFSQSPKFLRTAIGSTDLGTVTIARVYLEAGSLIVFASYVSGATHSIDSGTMHVTYESV